MSGTRSRNRRARPRGWKSHGIASQSFVAESDKGAGGTSSLSRRDPRRAGRAAKVVSPALWLSQSLGYSGGARTWLPHRHVDAASRRLAGEGAGMGPSAASANAPPDPAEPRE